MGAAALASPRLLTRVASPDHAAHPNATPPGGFDLARWIQPVPDHAVFREPGWFVWCGTMVRGADGRCHLYYSRWRREEGFYAWVTHSEIAHAVADHPLGPYRHADVALPARGPDFWDGHCTHNPAVMESGGRYYLYYMGNRGDRKPGKGLNFSHRNNQRIGVAVADSPDGPWRRDDRPLIDATPGFHDALCCANPAVMRRPGGDFLMIYKGVAKERPLPFGGPVAHIVATSPSPAGPFTKLPVPVFTKPGADFPAEDPCIWYHDFEYRAVVKDMKGFFTREGRSLALMRSPDGIDWSPAPRVLVGKTEYTTTAGRRVPLHALERPQIWLDGGEPAVLFCAASPDKQPGGGETYNIAIPLKRPAP
ncbi:sucrase [Termitidicoccus mucosus]|uniref:Sucrase n=1 Tax=Termitidicoccus mucosus TaxID=1184151 RepID=A0A178IPZ5_9BACT|nr:sucrase [Opitutaceae bacterium TSB47]